MLKSSLIFLFLSLGLSPLWAQGRFHDDFSQSSLRPEWQHLRQPDAGKYALKDGRLRLYGDIFEPREREQTTFIGLTQRDNRFKAETKLTLFDSESGDEAGLCVYRSDSCYVQASLNNFRNEHRLKLRFQLLTHRWLLIDKNLGRHVSEIWLRVVCNGRYYNFYYSLNGQKYQWLESVECLLLSPAIAKTAEPPMVGLFAYTGSTKYQTGYSYADFDYFDYEAQ